MVLPCWFDRLLESLTHIVSSFKSTPVGTGKHVLKILILLAIGALLGMIRFFVVIFYKFVSLRADIEPVVDELRSIDSLFRLGTSRCHFK